MCISERPAEAVRSLSDTHIIATSRRLPFQTIKTVWSFERLGIEVDNVEGPVKLNLGSSGTSETIGCSVAGNTFPDEISATTRGVK